ncbi:hypothetical protein KO501_15105 [Alteromonas sp. C1M14]|nr:DUF6314 family protein [Alteromonas sp. C1M14]MBU2979558.1 hypothetical protein [Alteromonas sp. C1M14]
MSNNSPHDPLIKKTLPASLNDFVGNWLVTRTIVQNNGDKFQFVGNACFTWCKSQLHYQETGQVTGPNGNTLLAERAYIWQQSSRNRFDVLFDDERYFHTFSVGQPHGEHLCGDDNYVVDYGFQSWPTWSSTWEVKGPRKDYTMHSIYQRR